MCVVPALRRDYESRSPHLAWGAASSRGIANSVIESATYLPPAIRTIDRALLQEREVDVDVEPLRLETGEAIGDGLERLADCIEMVQPFLETEVGKVVGAEFVAQERRELLILLEEGSLEIGAEDMMAMLDLIDNGCPS